MLMSLQLIIGNALYYHCSCVNFVPLVDNIIIIIGVTIAVALLILVISIIVVVVIHCRRQPNTKPSRQRLCFGPNARMSIYPDDQNNRRLPVPGVHEEMEISDNGGQYSTALPEFPRQHSTQYNRRLPNDFSSSFM